MNKVFLAVALICGVAMGCDSTDIEGREAPATGHRTAHLDCFDYTVVH